MKKILLSVLIMVGTAAVFAQVPSTLSYQGILIQSSGPNAGQPVSDGTHFVRFFFYNVPTGGTALYSSTGTGSGNSVTTFKGMFTFTIGSGSPGNDPIPSNIFNQQLYVEIVADGVTLTPRIPLTTVPYAMVAQQANAMDAANLTGTLNPARIAAGAIDNSKLASGIDAGKLTTGTLPAARIGNDAIDNAKMADNSITSAEITDGTIVNADINASASIAVTKLAAGTNGQILTTSAGVPTWTTPAAVGTVTSVATGTGLTGGPITTTGTVSIATGGVTTTLLADNSVTSAKIVDATIATVDLADNSVTSAKIADGTIATADLADGSVTAAKLASGAAVSGTGAANRVAFWSGTSALSSSSNFTWNGTQLGIGPSTVSNFLHVAADVGSSSVVTLEGHSTTATRGPGISFIRSKGSLATPSAVANGDYLGGIGGSGRTASAYNLSSEIQFNVDGTVTGTSVPGRIVFSTTTAGSSSPSEKMRLTNDGRLGIGNSAPASFLDVASNGNQWDLATTEGDVRIGTNTHRIKMGIATTGGGAGDAYIGSQGGTNRLFLGAGTTTAQFQTIAITGGRVGIGTVSPGSKLHVAGADWDVNPLLLSANASSAGATLRFTSPDAGNRTYDIIGSTGTGATMGAGSFGIWDNTVFAYRFVISPTGTVGIGLTAPSFRLDLPNTATDAGGRGRSNSWVTYSDTRVKSGQKPINYGLKEVLAMNPKRYVHHSSEFESGKLSLKEGTETIGLIAQEVYQVVPEIVSKPQDESKELWSLDYNKLVPVLIKAIQEQQALITSQQSSLAELKAELAELRKLVMAQQKATASTTATIGNE